MSFFGNRRMPELRFAITQQQKSVTGSRWLTQALATLAVLDEESLTQASFQTLSLMGSCTESTLLWMDNKPDLPL